MFRLMPLVFEAFASQAVFVLVAGAVVSAVGWLADSVGGDA